MPARESEIVVELLEQFLESGFTQEAAARMVNSALVLKGQEGMFSTVDICAVDLYTGICEFLKAGAASTFIKRDHWVESISSEFHQFNPVDFDPKQWARAAKEAGMKYVVLTAKHHDGFCLFDSQYTDFKSTNTPYGRDIVKEFVEAVRAEGLKVGLYFTCWTGTTTTPTTTIRTTPCATTPPTPTRSGTSSRYVEYMHNQVREICTNYGRKLDILWFDFSYENENYVMRGETWGATELVNMVRELQPGIIIDNRLEVSGEGFGSLWECDPHPLSRRLCQPRADYPPQRHPGQAGPGHGVGGLRHHDDFPGKFRCNRRNWQRDTFSLYFCSFRSGRNR